MEMVWKSAIAAARRQSDFVGWERPLPKFQRVAFDTKGTVDYGFRLLQSRRSRSVGFDPLLKTQFIVQAR